MRKQKIIKMTASPLDPSLEGSFQPPVTHSGDISIVFRDKDMSIHGWDGSAWSTIYTKNADDKQFTFTHTYQNYYVKSLTGSDESFSASFFSVGKYEGSTPLLAGVQRGTKLYDIEEVPVYTASDANKLLTIMSDGSLAWLLANESYIVESEGGDGGGAPAVPQASFIEDNPGFTGNAVDGIWTDSGSGGGHWSQIRLSADGIIDYTNGEPTHDEFTISWWMNLNSSQAATNITVAGRHLGSINGVNRNFKINLGNVGAGVTNPHFQVYLGSTIMGNLYTGVNMGDTWTHCAVVCKSDGSQLVISAYLNGNKLPGTRTKPLGTKLLPPEAYDGFGWGGNGQSGSTVKGQFDSMQIEGGIALTDEQVAAIAAQADRQMGIAAAAGASQEAPVGIIGDVLAHPDTTIVGNPVYENGVLTLDGSSYMIHGDISEFMYQDYMTTNLWFKNTGGSRKSKFWAFGMNRTAENKYAHVLQQNNDVDLRFVSAAGATIDPTHNSVDDGQWHMITAVWDNVNGFKRLYLDGVQLGSDITFAAKSDPFRNGDDAHGLIVGTGTGAGSVRAGEAYMGQFTKMEIENAIWDASQIASKFAEGSGVS